MSAMVQFLPALARASGKQLRSEQVKLVDTFVQAMAFYIRRDVDKSHAEDKHVFRVDELMQAGALCGLRVEFRANETYDSIVAGSSAGDPAFFEYFLRSYLKFCMSWPDDLIARLDELMPVYCRQVAEASREGSGPYMHGVFLCRKTA